MESVDDISGWPSSLRHSSTFRRPPTTTGDDRSTVESDILTPLAYLGSPRREEPFGSMSGVRAVPLGSGEEIR